MNLSLFFFQGYHTGNLPGIFVGEIFLSDAREKAFQISGVFVKELEIPKNS